MRSRKSSYTDSIQAILVFVVIGVVTAFIQSAVDPVSRAEAAPGAGMPFDASRVAQLQAKVAMAIANPSLIPALSDEILKTLTDARTTKGVPAQALERLTRMQTQLANYYRIQRILSSPNCHVDPTTSNPIAAKLLKASAEQPVCSPYSVDLLAGFKNFDTLVDVLQMMDDDSYSGVFAIAEDQKNYNPSEKRRGGGLTLDNGRGQFISPGMKVVEGTVLRALASRPQDPKELPERFRGELFRQGLRNNFNTYVELHSRYSHPDPSASSPEELTRHFCHPAGVQASCTLPMETHLLDQAKVKLKNSKSRTSGAIASELNGYVDRMNAVLMKLAKNAMTRDEIHIVVPARNGQPARTMVLPGAASGSEHPTDFSNIGVAHKDYAEYRAIYSQMMSRQDPMQKLLLQSQFEGALALRPYSIGTVHLPYPRITEAEVSQAIDDNRGRVVDTAKAYLTTYHSKDSTETQIKEMIRIKPFMAAGLLMKDPGFTPLACQAIKQLSVDQMNANQRKDATKVAVQVASLIATLAGVPAAPLLVGADRLGESAIDHAYADEEMDHALSELDQERASQASENKADAKKGMMIGAAMIVFEGAGLANRYSGALKASAEAGKLGRTLENELEALAKSKQSTQVSRDAITSLLKKYDRSELFRALQVLKEKMNPNDYATFYETALAQASTPAEFTLLAREGLLNPGRSDTQLMVSSRLRSNLHRFFAKNPTSEEMNDLIQAFPSLRELATRQSLSAGALIEKGEFFDWALNQVTTRQQYYQLAEKYLETMPGAYRSIARSFRHLEELEASVTDQQTLIGFGRDRVKLLEKFEKPVIRNP
ncbi:MAG: hypothetical protein H7222_05310 [Methylotenera sp.]|nr:hypothetical protein [Oligoflexia bacterium]